MWSGPRNISTAMMRSFENRPDTRVVDEPLYGYYLKATGFDDIMQVMDCDWHSVCQALTDEPVDESVYYQKHMTQHILPEMDLSFTDKLVNAFLIRQPEKIIASYSKVREEFDIEELGFRQQLAIFEREKQRTGVVPPVVDSDQLLDNPEATMRRLCDKLGIEFLSEMMNWPAGKRDTDGIWAPYWYSQVEKSTGFTRPPEKQVEVPEQFVGMLDEANSIYQKLKAYHI